MPKIRIQYDYYFNTKSAYVYYVIYVLLAKKSMLFLFSLPKSFTREFYYNVLYCFKNSLGFYNTKNRLLIKFKAFFLLFPPSLKCAHILLLNTHTHSHVGVYACRQQKKCVRINYSMKRISFRLLLFSWWWLTLEILD